MTARIAGYITRAQAGLVPPKSVTALNGRRMEGVAVHHGAGATPIEHAKCITTWRAYQRMHMNDPADPKVDIAYNYGVCRHGYALEGRTYRYQPGANGIPWKNGYHPNRTNFAVCVIGSGNVVFSTVVTDAVEWCIQECRTKGNAGLRVRPHSFFASTGCPDTKLRAWAATIDGKPIQTTTAPAKPTPTSPEEDDMPTVEEIWGAQVGTGENRRTMAEVVVAAERRAQAAEGNSSAALARLAALESVVKGLAVGQGIDPDALADAVEQAVRDGFRRAGGGDGDVVQPAGYVSGV